MRQLVDESFEVVIGGDAQAAAESDRLDELLPCLLKMKRREPVRWIRDEAQRGVELKIDVVEERGITRGSGAGGSAAMDDNARRRHDLRERAWRALPFVELAARHREHLDAPEPQDPKRRWSRHG
jgi:hypothetical protein